MKPAQCGLFLSVYVFRGGSTLEYIITNETMDLSNNEAYMLMTCLTRRNIVAKMYYGVCCRQSNEKTYSFACIRKLSFFDDFSIRVARLMFLELLEDVGADFIFDKERLDPQEKETLQTVGYPVIEDVVMDVLCDAYDTRTAISHMMFDMRMNGADHQEDQRQAMNHLIELSQTFNGIGHVISYRITPTAPQSARAGYRNALQSFEELHNREMKSYVFGLDSKSDDTPFTLSWLAPIHDVLNQAENELHRRLSNIKDMDV